MRSDLERKEEGIREKLTQMEFKTQRKQEARQERKKLKVHAIS